MQRFTASGHLRKSLLHDCALLRSAALVALLGALPLSLLAQTKPMGTSANANANANAAGSERRGPPAQAVAACSSLASGGACHFQGRGREVVGTCWAPQGKPLACKPTKAPATEATGPGPKSAGRDSGGQQR